MYVIILLHKRSIASAQFIFQEEKAMKKQRLLKFFSLLLVLSLVFSAVAVTAGASVYGKVYFINSVTSAQSAPSGYTAITSAEDFSQIGKAEAFPANGKYILMNDIDFQGKTFNNNIVEKFNGELDGNGYEISGVKIKTDGKSEDVFAYVGIFGEVYGDAVIKNLGIKVDVNAILAETENGPKAQIGGLVGAAYGIDPTNYSEEHTVTIRNCYAVTSIQVKGTPKYIDIGGLAGEAADGAVIQNCYSVPDIVVTAENGEDTECTVGGIVGWTNAWFRSVTVEGCVVNGLVSAKPATGNYYDYQLFVGGIVGAAYATEIKKCANISAPSTDGSCGVVVKNAQDVMAGGIAGHGTCNSLIDECYNTATVNVQVKDGFADVGGIVGYCSSESLEILASTVSNSFNTGEVFAWANGKRDYGSTFVEAGGIAGVMGTEDDVFAIVNCYNASAVIEAYINENGTKSTDPEYTRVGAISGSDKFLKATEVKGVYTCPVTANSTNSSVKVLSKAEMAKKESYTGFNFTTVWNINSAAAYPYPTLRCMSKFDKNLSTSGKALTVKVSDLRMVPEETAKISYEVSPENAEIVKTEWYSSDESVAKVSADGTVTALATGTATVVCKFTDANGAWDICECEVSVSSGILQTLIDVFMMFINLILALLGTV